MTRPVRTVVVDDEPVAREAIRTLLRAEPEIHVVAEAANGLEALEVIRAAHPELLFLDVQMPDLDGFQVLERLGDDVPPAIVFVTAYDRHALRAFEVRALDYLLKPFGKPRFRVAVERALERLAAEDRTLGPTVASLATPGGDPGALATAGESEPEAARALPRRLAIRTGETMRLVDVESIVWVEACGDYVRIHAGRETHLVAERMHGIERLLDPRRFVRIHRSTLVRLEAIRELAREPDGSGAIALEDGVRLRVARGRWQTLERALEIARL